MSTADQLDQIIALRAQRVSWERISSLLGPSPNALRVRLARARTDGLVPKEPERALLQVKLSQDHDRWLLTAAHEHHVPAAQIVESALRCWLAQPAAGDKRRFAARLVVKPPRVPLRRTFRVDTRLIEQLRRRVGCTAVGYQGSLGEHVERALVAYAKGR